MYDELKKSIQSVLYERISSPLSGTFLFSWLVWNWKILYILFFGEGFQTVIEKLNYIETNYINFLNSILFPILSTAFLVFLYPYLVTFVYKFWLKAKKKQSDIKDEIERQKLLTYEQSLALRLEIRQHKESVNNLLNEKDEEIKLLKEKLQFMDDNYVKSNKKNEILKDEFENFMNDEWASGAFEEIIKTVQEHLNPAGRLNADIISYYKVNDIIQNRSNDPLFYEFTTKGNYFVKEYLNRRRRINKLL